MASKHVRNAWLRHGNPELLALADDQQVAPALVLSGQAHDQLDGFVQKRWPPIPIPWLTLWAYPHAIEERNRAAATIMSQVLAAKREPAGLPSGA